MNNQYSKDIEFKGIILDDDIAQDDSIWGVVLSTKQSVNQVQDFGDIKELVIKIIESLPPLPETISKIESLKLSEDRDLFKLLAIIQWDPKDPKNVWDPMIAVNILKVANSAMYWYWWRIKTVKDALLMLGFNMISNIAISTSLNSVLKPDLEPYSIDIDTFLSKSSIQSRLIEKWDEKAIRAIKHELTSASFMQEIGKIVVSIVLKEKWLIDKFKWLVNELKQLDEAEEKAISQTSAVVTAIVFSQWRFNDYMIKLIENSDKPENAPEDLSSWAYALKIVKTLAPIGWDNFSQEALDRAFLFADKAWFDPSSLQKAIYNVDK